MHYKRMLTLFALRFILFARVFAIRNTIHYIYWRISSGESWQNTDLTCFRGASCSGKIFILTMRESREKSMNSKNISYRLSF